MNERRAVHDVPPRSRLAQVLASLSHHLPAQLAGLIDHTRFADGAQALARLGDPVHAAAALDAVAETEAAWLLELLLERWAAVAEVVLDPVAAIASPAEVWVGVEPVRVPVEVVVLGADPGWEAVWEGATPGSGGRATLLIDPAVSSASCRAHVRARSAGQRLALTATARIAVRRASVAVRDDRRRIVVLDQTGAAAAGVTLRIGDVEHIVGPGGLVELDEPAARGAPLRVQGIAVGRIPDVP